MGHIRRYLFGSKNKFWNIPCPTYLVDISDDIGCRTSQLGIGISPSFGGIGSMNRRLDSVCRSFPHIFLAHTRPHRGHRRPLADIGISASPNHRFLHSHSDMARFGIPLGWGSKKQDMVRKVSIVLRLFNIFGF